MYLVEGKRWMIRRMMRKRAKEKVTEKRVLKKAK